MSTDKQLDLILANSQMLIIRQVLQNSINDIKFNNPHRTDLIIGMEKRLLELCEIQMTYMRLEDDHKSVIKKLYELHAENLALKKEVQELKQFL
jgi:hypothetical protein